MPDPRWQVLKRWFVSGVRAVDALVFPWECLVCDAPSSSPFCDACRLELREASAGSCPRCAMPAGPWADLEGGCSECRGRPLGFDGAIAVGPYQGPIRDLCLRLKREADAWLAPWLSDLLIEAHRDAFEALPPGTAVVPIPLHWRRRWERGYNQAEALAIGLARRRSLPISKGLRRVAATPKLSHAGRGARMERMHDAFRVDRRARLEGRTVLLVDDILTTGATCGAAARALKKAGAGRVLVAVIGRAEGSR